MYTAGNAGQGYGYQQQTAEQQQQLAAQQQQQLAEQQQQGYDTGGHLPVDGNVHLTTDDFDKHTERSYYFSIRGSYQDFKKGTTVPIWRACEGQEHIYQRIAGMDGLNPVYEGDLAKMLILGADLNWCQNNFPDAWGCNITGIQGKTYSKLGRSYAFIAPSKQMTPAGEIFTPKSMVTREMLAKYNDTSIEKLQAHIFRQEGTSVSLVDNISPLSWMFRANAQVLNLSFGLQPGQEGFLRVPDPIVEACVRRYEEDQKVQFVNGKNFQLEFERVNSPDNWTDPAGVSDNLRSYAKGSVAHISSQRMTNTYECSGKITLKQVLYGNNTSG